MTVLSDTNVLVRLVVNDDREQVERALLVLEDEGLAITPTVLLECAWVLRSRYGLAPERIVEAFQALERTEGVSFTDAEAAHAAIAWFAAGMDIADAIHLSQATAARRLATFDRDLAASAANLGVAESIRLI